MDLLGKGKQKRFKKLGSMSRGKRKGKSGEGKRRGGEENERIAWSRWEKDREEEQEIS